MESESNCSIKEIDSDKKEKQKVPRDRSKLIAVTLWSCVGSLLLKTFCQSLLMKTPDYEEVKAIRTKLEGETHLSRPKLKNIAYN
ncbi:hypothetical protein JVX94_11890 [Bacillus sp. PDNC022]|nr:hypothetical protein JVX94_11890 [Bacillus sp. PDNC022]